MAEGLRKLTEYRDCDWIAKPFFGARQAFDGATRGEMAVVLSNLVLAPEVD